MASSIEQEAQAWVEAIRQHAADDEEVAHIKEDQLHVWFIQHIADGSLSEQDARDVAAIVLTTETINFRRWCG